MNQDDIDRFWAHVDRSDPNACWLWDGLDADYSKYGHCMRDGKQCAAHRVAYELIYGPIPTGYLVCHHCDHKPCINPSHLFVGTQKDNLADMTAKGRRVTCGKANPDGSQLKKKIRRWLADKDMTQKELAHVMNLSESYVHQIFASNGKVTRSFKWRFIQAFGHETTTQVFGNRPGVQP